jgi:hypothetical protein
VETPPISRRAGRCAGRHIDGKTEALKEVEKIFDSVRDGVLGKNAGKLTLRQLGETYFAKYVSPKSSAPLGQGERYRWNLIVNTVVDGKMLGDYIAVEVKKHHVESFADASRVQRTVSLVDVRGTPTRRNEEASSRQTGASAG